MRSTFKVLFYVKKGSEKPNGNLPLMCRLTVDGEIKQFSCKMDVPLRLWDVKNNRASGKSVEAQRINLAVDKIRVEVNRRYQELMQTDGYVTAAKLKDAYLGIGVKQETLLKLFEQHNAEFAKKVGHSRAQGTFTPLSDGLQPHSGVSAPYLQARGHSAKGTQPHIHQRLRVFPAHGEEMPHQYRVGLHDCAETHRFHSEERRASAVQPLCRVHQLARKRQ